MSQRAAKFWVSLALGVALGLLRQLPAARDQASIY